MKRKLQMLVAAVALTGVLAAVAIAASSPSVSTGKATNITKNTVVLHATINPNGSSTAYIFEWGLTTGYGSFGHFHSAGKGTTPVNVQGTEGGLIPGTVYHYNIIAGNKYGTTVGRDRTFKTAGPPPPSVTTGAATNVGVNTATLTAVINPHGAATTWWFDYGITSAYGSRTFGGTLPAGRAPVTVSETVSGLERGTFFHFRIVANNDPNATSYGSDQILLTEPLPRPGSHLSAKVAPRRERSKPFVFTVSGTVRGPSWIPHVFDCNGDVAVHYLMGGKLVAFELAPVQPDCTFSVQAVFARKPGRGPRRRVVDLRVLFRFRGNGYLLPSRARPQQITLG
jgi:hypothetical protein